MMTQPYSENVLMAGHRKFSEITRDLSAEEKERISEHTRELKKTLVLTEALQMLGIIPQDTIDSMRIGTLSDYVQLLGGRLKIVIELPNAEVTITQFNRAHDDRAA
jgi:hypothetical protein